MGDHQDHPPMCNEPRRCVVLELSLPGGRNDNHQPPRHATDRFIWHFYGSSLPRNDRFVFFLCFSPGTHPRSSLEVMDHTFRRISIFRFLWDLWNTLQLVTAGSASSNVFNAKHRVKHGPGTDNCWPKTSPNSCIPPPRKLAHRVNSRNCK